MKRAALLNGSAALSYRPTSQMRKVTDAEQIEAIDDGIAGGWIVHDVTLKPDGTNLVKFTRQQKSGRNKFETVERVITCSMAAALHARDRMGEKAR